MLVRAADSASPAEFWVHCDRYTILNATACRIGYLLSLKDSNNKMSGFGFGCAIDSFTSVCVTQPSKTQLLKLLHFAIQAQPTVFNF